MQECVVAQSRYLLAIRNQDIGCRNKAPPSRLISAHVYAVTSWNSTVLNATPHRNFGIVCRWTSYDPWGLLRGQRRKFCGSLNTKMKWSVAIKIMWRMRYFSLLHPPEKLDRSVEVLRLWLLDRLRVIGVEIVLIRGTKFLLTPATQSFPRRTTNSLRVWRGSLLKPRRLWYPFLSASNFGTVPWDGDGDGFSGWFSQLYCIHLWRLAPTCTIVRWTFSCNMNISICIPSVYL